GVLFVSGEDEVPLEPLVIKASDVSTWEGDLAEDAADVEVLLYVPLDTLKSVLLICSKALTVKTNSAEMPDDVFVLGASEPLAWNLQGASDVPFTADMPFTAPVARLYVTSPGPVGRLYVSALFDLITP